MAVGRAARLALSMQTSALPARMIVVMLRRVRGRERELDAVGELADMAGRGKGGGPLGAGPRGAGKTRSPEEARAIARRSGLRTASAEAFEGQRGVPFTT